jgi:hypothetical protein
LATSRKNCLDKIVQRFYETPEGLSSGSNKRKAKIPIPAAPQAGFPLSYNKLATGYFGIFATAHRAVVPHFRFKKDLILYLNSSRAAPRVGISTSFRQAAGNSNLNIHFRIQEIGIRSPRFLYPFSYFLFPVSGSFRSHFSSLQSPSSIEILGLYPRSFFAALISNQWAVESSSARKRVIRGSPLILNIL